MVANVHWPIQQNLIAYPGVEFALADVFIDDIPQSGHVLLPKAADFPHPILLKTGHLPGLRSSLTPAGKESARFEFRPKARNIASVGGRDFARLRPRLTGSHAIYEVP